MQVRWLVFKWAKTGISKCTCVQSCSPLCPSVCLCVSGSLSSSYMFFSHCVALSGLEFTTSARLAWNVQRSTSPSLGLCLSSVGRKVPPPHPTQCVLFSHSRICSRKPSSKRTPFPFLGARTQLFSSISAALPLLATCLLTVSLTSRTW